MKLRYSRFPIERKRYISDVPFVDYKNWFRYPMLARGGMSPIYIPGLHFEGETDEDFERREKRQRKIAEWEEAQK